MLDDLTRRLVSLEWWTSYSGELVLLAMGFLRALIRCTWSDREMLLAPSFALCALLLALSKVPGFIWLASAHAKAAGLSLLLISAWSTTMIAIGGGFGWLAASRARNAFSRGYLGLLLLVPIANVWLMVVPPRREGTGDHGRLANFLSGYRGLLVGIVMICLVPILANIHKSKIEEIHSGRLGVVDAARAVVVERGVGVFGLEEMLQRSAVFLTDRSIWMRPRRLSPSLQKAIV